MKANLLATAVVAAGLSVIAGCGSGSSSTGTTTTSVAAPTTTAAAPTTTAPATTVAATTTVAAIAELTLRGDGLGPFDFGASYDDMIAALTDALGEPTGNSITEYIPDDLFGFATDEEIPYAYDAPVGRTVCWGYGTAPTGGTPGHKSFCAEFGGADQDSLFLTGWWHSCFECDPNGSLTTASGLTAGSRGSDDPAITVEFAQGGGCEQLAVGNDIDGIHIYLQSLGAPFVIDDATGVGIPNVPDPADVVIAYMETDGVPSYVGGDCANFVYTYAGF